MKRFFVLPFLLVASLRADVSLPSIFSDGMVLQQAQLVPVWGKADAGESVKVTLGDQTQSTTATQNGTSVCISQSGRPGIEVPLSIGLIVVQAAT